MGWNSIESPAMAYYSTYTKDSDPYLRLDARAGMTLCTPGKTVPCGKVCRTPANCKKGKAGKERVKTIGKEALKEYAEAQKIQKRASNLGKRSKMQNPSDIYESGKAAKKFTEETNDYTKVVHGLADVMNANGHNVKPMELSDRWHSPLASIPSSESFDTVKRAITSQFEWSIKNYRPPSSNDAYTNYTADTEVNRIIGGIEDMAKRSLESAIKKEGIRRNTKRWKEVYEKNIDRFRDAAKQTAKEQAKKQISKFEMSARPDKKDADSAMRSSESMGRIAMDLQSLGVSPDLVAKARSISDDYKNHAERLANRYKPYIERLQAFIDEGRSDSDPYIRLSKAS